MGLTAIFKKELKNLDVLYVIQYYPLTKLFTRFSYRSVKRLDNITHIRSMCPKSEIIVPHRLGYIDLLRGLFKS